MDTINRRDFLKMGASLAAAMGLSSVLAPRVAEALSELAAGTAPVVWLQGQSCSGCSVSLLNAESPSVAEVLTGYISLLFHSTLSAAAGGTSMDVLHKAVEQGGYLLVVEGSVPAGMPDACRVGGQLFGDQLAEAARRAKAVVALGACAAHGGIPAAEGNPTQAASVPTYLKSQGVAAPIIALPGCPTHPDWLVGTLIHVLKFGLPPLDREGRPTMFYTKTVHEQCVRFRDYEREVFAKSYGEDGCYFKLGCAGPITKADCPQRQWNGGSNWCIRAGSPCIGCAGENFAAKAAYPFYTKRLAAGKED